MTAAFKTKIFKGSPNSVNSATKSRTESKSPKSRGKYVSFPFLVYCLIRSIATFVFASFLHAVRCISHIIIFN
jgi:hypothetical protein